MKAGTGWDDPPGVKMPFQIKKLDVAAGTSHPATARLLLQPAGLLKVTSISSGQQDLTGRYLFRCMEEFVKTEQKRDAFLQKCAQFNEQVKAGTGIIAQPHALELHEPEGMADDYQLFLLRLAIGLRMAVSAAGLILYEQALKWPTLSKRVKTDFPGHPLLVTIQTNEAWSSDLFDVRGEIEHDPYLFRGFTVQEDGSGALRVVEPQLPDGASAVQAFPKYYADGFAFSEELLVNAITTKLPEGFKIREIPEQQRDRSIPMRFVLERAEGVKSS